MKKTLAILCALTIFAAMTVPAAAAEDNAMTLQELRASAMEVGLWDNLSSGMYDPGLDGNGILPGTSIYGLYSGDVFSGNYTTIPAPTAIEGYTRASGPDAMTLNSFYVLNSTSGFDYVLVMSDSNPMTLDGLRAVSMEVGLWEELAPGMYDPSLDGNNIMDGTMIYGLFGGDVFSMDFSMIEAPTSIEGYTRASSPDAMTDKSFYVLTTMFGFNYVLVMEKAPAPPNYTLRNILIGLACAAVVAWIVYANIKSRKILAANA